MTTSSDEEVRDYTGISKASEANEASDDSVRTLNEEEDSDSDSKEEEKRGDKRGDFSLRSINSIIFACRFNSIRSQIDNRVGLRIPNKDDPCQPHKGEVALHSPFLDYGLRLSLLPVFR